MAVEYGTLPSTLPSAVPPTCGVNWSQKLSGGSIRWKRKLPVELTPPGFPEPLSVALVAVTSVGAEVVPSGNAPEPAPCRTTVAWSLGGNGALNISSDAFRDPATEGSKVK